jgi:hypothetical protein
MELIPRTGNANFGGQMHNRILTSNSRTDLIDVGQ